MTVMAMTLQQLRDASDEDLIKAHDDIAHALKPSVSRLISALSKSLVLLPIPAPFHACKFRQLWRVCEPAWPLWLVVVVCAGRGRRALLPTAQA